MKKIIPILLILIFICGIAFSDTFIIPLSCYPRELQKEFADTGRKLDLNGIDRTKDSWGFIRSEGAKYQIYTYRSATDEDLNVIMRLCMGGYFLDHNLMGD